MMPCPKCGSDKIMPNVRIVSIESGSSIQVHLEVYKDPEAVIFKGSCRDPLRAQVCGECGLTELYANRPRSLWKVYAKSAGGS